MTIPDQYNRLMPYLVIPNAYKFIDFMKVVFGAAEQMVAPRSEGVIMHGELRIGDSVIMFADVTEDISARPAGIFIYVDDLDEVYKKALAAGATSTMEPTQQSYGYTCGLKDPFGNDWWPVEIPKEK
ncbi:MAG: VOC family protein [Ferruginibacter sp.]